MALFSCSASENRQHGRLRCLIRAPIPSLSLGCSFNLECSSTSPAPLLYLINSLTFTSTSLPRRSLGDLSVKLSAPVVYSHRAWDFLYIVLTTVCFYIFVDYLIIELPQEFIGYKRAGTMCVWAHH